MVRDRRANDTLLGRWTTEAEPPLAQWVALFSPSASIYSRRILSKNDELFSRKVASLSKSDITAVKYLD